eukprot:IDg10288t1
MDEKELAAFANSLFGASRTPVAAKSSNNIDDDSDSSSGIDSPGIAVPVSGAVVATSQLNRAEPSSPSSNASTLSPPQTPFKKSVSGPQRKRRRSVLSSRRLSVAEIIECDDRGIAGWESDRKKQAACWPSVLEYPRLTRDRALFGTANEDVATESLELYSQSPVIAGTGVLPGSITRFLDHYQRDGVKFLYQLFERDRGGLLADAMGLGKTVQVVCFLGAAFGVWARCSQGDGEDVLNIRTWTPFRVEIYSRSEEPRLVDALENNFVDVIVVGEHSLRSQIDGFFTNPLGVGKWKWNVLIVDEIHVAKNRNSQIHRAIARVPAKVKFGMTGTAIQNNLKELWNVMSLVVPSNLWPSYASFESEYIKPIELGTKRDAKPLLAKRARRRIEGLRKALGKHFIRRPKSVVSAQMPNKIDFCVMMRMDRNGLQGKMYQKLLASYDVKMIRDANQPCDCGSGLYSRMCCHCYPKSKEQRYNAPLWKIQHPIGIPCKRCPYCVFLRVMHVSQWIARHALLILPDKDEKDAARAKQREELSRYYMGLGPRETMKPMLQLEQDKK